MPQEISLYAYLIIKETHNILLKFFLKQKNMSKNELFIKMTPTDD